MLSMQRWFKTQRKQYSFRSWTLSFVWTNFCYLLMLSILSWHSTNQFAIDHQPIRDLIQTNGNLRRILKRGSKWIGMLQLNTHLLPFLRIPLQEKKNFTLNWSFSDYLTVMRLTFLINQPIKAENLKKF